MQGGIFLLSVGIDLVEIERIEKSIKRGYFLKKILGPDEYKELEKKNFSSQSVAANFCAKEAFLKSIGKGLGFCDLRCIETLRKKSGEPYLKLSGKAQEYVKMMNISFCLSLTHSKNYASAVVICESK